MAKLKPLFHQGESMASQITLHLQGEGAITFSFSLEAAKKLKAALAELLGRLKVVASQVGEGRAVSVKEPAMEFVHTSEVFLEVYCNPNIWPSPYAAKLMVTVRDERIRISGEAELPRIVEDLNLYIEQIA